MNSMKINKLAAACLLAGIIAMTSGFVTRLIHPAAPVEHHGDSHGDEKRVLAAYVKHSEAAEVKSDAPSGPEPVAALLASADIEAGKKIFKKCQSCHNAEKGGANKTGPALYGVVGNDVASHEGFKYSSALEGVSGNWTYDALNNFLYNPKGYVKGTKMVFAGLKKTADRAAVIAYLRAQDDSPEPLP
jgi:cytochrome c